MNFTDFESFLVLEDNGNQNEEDTYTKNIKNMLLAALL